MLYVIHSNFHFTEYIVVFNGYYSTSARDGYVMAALDPSAVNSWKIIPRHNPASDYPSDFSLVKVCIQKKGAVSKNCNYIELYMYHVHVCCQNVVAVVGSCLPFTVFHHLGGVLIVFDKLHSSHHAVHVYNFQLKGDTSNGVDALKRHPKVRSVTPQKRVERFLKSIEGTGWCNTYCHFKNFFMLSSFAFCIQLHYKSINCI